MPALILTGDTPEAEAVWGTISHEGAIETGRAPLDALPDRIVRDEQLTVILPGDAAAARTLTLPVKGDRQIAAAAGLALEDILAEPVERFHLGFGGPNAAGARKIVAMPVDEMSGWMDALGAAGTEPVFVAIDHTLLSAENHDAIVYRSGERLLCAAPEGSFSGSALALGPVADAMTVAADAPLRVADRGEADLILDSDTARLAFFYACSARGLAPNLRRGIYRKRRNWGRSFAPFARTGALAGTCAVLWLAFVFVDASRHAQAARALDDASFVAFSDAFPSVAVRDLRQQAEARLPAGTGGPAFLTLATLLAEEVAENAGVRVLSFNYSAAGDLLTELSFPNARALEAVRTGLEERGVLTEESGTLRREDDGSYAGELTLAGL